MNLELIILEKLDLVDPRMLREATLLQDVRQDAPSTSLAELRLKVRALESKNQITVVNDEDYTRIKITSAGKARLAETLN